MAMSPQAWTFFVVVWFICLGSSAVLVRSWSPVFVIVMGPLLLALAWRTATFRREVDESRGVTVGRYLIPRVIRKVSGEDTLVSTLEARPVIAVFDHAGRNDHVWVALAGGVVEGFSVEENAIFAVKEDVFRRWRPCETIAPQSQVELDVFRPMLATLWNAEKPGSTEIPAATVGGLESDLVRGAVTLGLVEIPQLHSNLGDRLSLRPAGRVALAALERADGNEIYPGAKESRVGDVTNYGVWNDHSPGAAAVQGAGTAIGGDVDGLDPEIVDMLHQLVVAVGEMASQLEPDDRDVVEASAESIDDMLSSGRPNQSKLRRATRTILARLETIALGAAGSGAWTGLVRWAGL